MSNNLNLWTQLIIIQNFCIKAKKSGKLIAREVNMTFIVLNIISFILVLIGALNWGLIGIFNWNMVSAIFGGYNAGSIIVYVLVFAASLWLAFYAIYSLGRIDMAVPRRRKVKSDETVADNK